MPNCCVHCSHIMSQLELTAYITEENKRRKRKLILLTQMYCEMSCLAMAYLTSQRPAKDPRFFDDDEEKIAYRKYILRELYNGSEVTCYDELCLTKRNFHDLLSLLL